MNDPLANPYLTATYAPRPTAPFSGIGVLADTQASINFAQNAIAAYGYNLDAERDRAQARVIKDVNHPYAVKQTDYLGRAGVLGAQGENVRAGNAALYQGVPIDQFDPITGQLGVSKDKDGNPLYGGILAPTLANPTVAPSEMQAFSDRAFNTPYAMPPDLGAEGQLSPLADPGTAAPAVTNLPPLLTNPYNVDGLEIPGTPSSMVGITRKPQPQPQLQLKPGVAPSTLDMARENLEDMITEMSSINRDLQEAEMKIAQSSNPVEREWYTAAKRRAIRARDNLAVRERKATAYLQGLTETVGPSPLSQEFNNYNIPRVPQAQGAQDAQGADPIPSAGPNATSFEPPPAMVRQAPALAQRFKDTAATYTQHAPGGPGGVEAALLINALESNMRPDAKAGSSSATGGAQFTSDTWKKGARKWKMPWAEGKTDEELLALRSSPPHMAQMERALRMQNLSIATSDKYAGKFDPYNPLNLYAMHHFNPERGADLAAALRTKPNASVASVFGPDYWNAALAANPYLAPNGRSMTVAQLYSNWINRAKALGFYGGAQA